jgi:hypothetical protein
VGIEDVGFLKVKQMFFEEMEEGFAGEWFGEYVIHA